MRGKFTGAAEAVTDATTYDLTMPSGQQVSLPMRRHETTDDHGRTSAHYSIDWYAWTRGDCPRCNGYAVRESGGCSSGAGFIPLFIDRRPSTDKRGHPLPIGYARPCGACDCAFGAWRHQALGIPYADDLAPELAGLGADDWAALMVQATAVECGGEIEADYRTLAMRIGDEPTRERILRALGD